MYGNASYGSVPYGGLLEGNIQVSAERSAKLTGKSTSNDSRDAKTL